MNLCLCISVFVYFSVCLLLSLHRNCPIWICGCISMFMYVFLCLFISMFVHFYVCAFLCLCISMFVYFYVYVFLPMLMYFYVCVYFYVSLFCRPIWICVYEVAKWPTDWILIQTISFTSKADKKFSLIWIWEKEKFLF